MRAATMGALAEDWETSRSTRTTTAFQFSQSDPPPLKWSDLRYVFDIKEDSNAKEAFKPEEIVAKLRQVDVLTSQGQTLADAIRQIGASEVSTRSVRQRLKPTRQLTRHPRTA